MNEPFEGKQHAQPPGPSPLRIEQQVPGSDNVVSETQLETSDRSPYQGFDAVEAAFLDRVQAKPLQDSKETSQPPLPLSQKFGIAKCSSSIALESLPAFVFGRGPTTKPPPAKADHSAPGRMILADTAIPSIETAANDDSVKSSCVISAGLPHLHSPARIELVESSINDQYQKAPHTRAASFEHQRTEILEVVPSQSIAATRVSPQPTRSLTPITKMKGNMVRVKRARKMLLSLPLRPWPPRQDQGPCDSAGISGVSTVDYKEKARKSDHKGEDFAVKCQSGEISRLIDGPCDEEQHSIATEADTPKDAVIDNGIANRCSVEGASSQGQDSSPQHQAPSDVLEVQPILVTSSSAARDDQSSCDSYEGPNTALRTQYASIVPSHDAAALPKELKIIEPPLDKLQANTDLHVAPSQQSKKQLDQQLLSNNGNISSGPVLDPLSHVVVAEDMLHGVSDRSGVTGEPTMAQVIHDARPRITTGVKSNHKASRTTAISSALVSLREACLADQCWVEDQMTKGINKLENDKVQLQKTISQQSTQIIELNTKLHTVEGCFKRLNEKVVSTQKYASGFQKDHETSRKLLAAFREQIKQLQNQITKVVKERDLLKSDLETVLESSARSHKALRLTMKETFMHYVTASSQKEILQNRLDERTSMHNEEKSRRIELETQLLPSVQSLQQQLSESSVALVDKINNLHTGLEVRAADSNIKECLRILQKLESLPLLTATDVRKAEDMLRFLHARNNSDFELLAKSSEIRPFPIEIVRQMLQDQTQSLRAELLRHKQVTVDDEQAQRNNQLLELDLNSQRRENRQKKEQINMLTAVEETLKVRVAEVEGEIAALRLSLCNHQKQSRKSELKMIQLQEKLAHALNDLQASNETIERHERLSLEQKRDFSKYRTESISHLSRLNCHLNHSSIQSQAQEREYVASQQLASTLKTKLESAESKTEEMTLEITQYKSDVKMLRQEHQSMMENEGRARALLESAQEMNLRLEEEKRGLSAEIDGYRLSLLESKGIEEDFCAERIDLQRQLAELHDLARSKEKQLQQTELDMGDRLQQAQAEYTNKLDGLQSRLTLSENARKESQAKLRQADEAQKHQLKCHEQKCKEKLDSLVAEADRQRERLKAEHLLEMERCRQDASTTVTEMIQKTQTRLVAAELAKPEVVVPNTQRSSQSDDSSELSQRKKDPKKVGRQSAHLYPDGNDKSTGYFEEEYENRYGSEVQNHAQETQHLVLEPETEVVPETQEFECARGGAANFGMTSPQLPAIDSHDHEEAATELSNMPSEDLSEMLLDLQSGSERAEANSRKLPSSRAAVRTPVQSARDTASDGTSSNSLDRLKSRANTASRMVPLPHQDMQQQHVQADGRVRHVRSGRNINADHIDTADSSHSSHKRKSVGSIHGYSSFKKPRTSIQSNLQRPLSTSKSYTSYTPDVDAQTNAHVNPSCATSRRLSNRQASISGSQSGSPRLSSTRNTRSKTRFADRFEKELDRR